MACAQAVSLTSREFRPAPFVELRQTLPSRVAIISRFVEQLMCFNARFRIRDGSELDIEMALREALAKAIVHCNLEEPCRCVYVACRCTTDGGVSITVEREGPGLDGESVADSTAPQNRLLTQGRGIYLMETLMDEVLLGQHGAVLYLRKAPNAPGVRRKKT